MRITCKFSYICNTCNFTCITCKEFWLTCKNRDSRQISSFSKKFGEIPTKFHQNLASKWQNSIKKCWKLKISFFIFEKSLTIFYWNFEVWAVQKYANLVDRVKSFPTSIYLQKSASIQPRTSLSKLHVSKFTCNTCKEMKITCNPPTKLLIFHPPLPSDETQAAQPAAQIALQSVMRTV